MAAAVRCLQHCAEALLLLVIAHAHILKDRIIMQMKHIDPESGAKVVVVRHSVQSVLQEVQ